MDLHSFGYGAKAYAKCTRNTDDAVVRMLAPEVMARYREPVIKLSVRALLG
jgi:hypothetical protein